MYKVLLQRTYSPKQIQGVLSVFYRYQHIYSCATLELPYRENRRNISAIPEGKYEVMKSGPTIKIPYNSFLVLDVPGRSGVKIHIANIVTELEGCIAVGQTHFDINYDGQQDTIYSKDTLEMLYRILPDRFVMKIIEL